MNKDNKLMSIFVSIEDPRNHINQLHDLVDILLIGIIPITKQNTLYKSLLFPFFFVINCFHKHGYAKNLCLKKEKYILIYL